MGFITTCDGCGNRIGEAPGESLLGMEGQVVSTYGLPPETFHWCQGCAAIASKAVSAARPEDSQLEEELIRRATARAMANPGRTVTVSPLPDHD
jgi:hypothetical protein